MIWVNLSKRRNGCRKLRWNLSTSSPIRPSYETSDRIKNAFLSSQFCLEHPLNHAFPPSTKICYKKYKNNTTHISLWSLFSTSLKLLPLLPPLQAHASKQGSNSIWSKQNVGKKERLLPRQMSVTKFLSKTKGQVFKFVAG